MLILSFIFIIKYVSNNPECCCIRAIPLNQNGIPLSPAKDKTMNYADQNKEALKAATPELEKNYKDLTLRNIQIDMTRGKPSTEQLDLADGLLAGIGREDCFGADGTDYRNYGLGTGIKEAKALFAEFLGVTENEIIIGGNASLTLMYDILVGGMLFGMPGGLGPWSAEGPVKFLCPAPGYDRHFAICERLGIEMIAIDMDENGPNMDQVESYVANDASVKGIWCVPKYSNPTGATYSDEVVDRLAKMPTAAKDFRIIWDNAYAYHHLGKGPSTVKNILDICKKVGTPDRPLLIGSTSKISLAGSGIAVMGGSVTNVKDAAVKISYATIGADKINQIRHIKFFGDMNGLKVHMDKHAEIVAPKFAAVERILNGRLGGKGIATWSKPEGGYFVSLDVIDGCAKEVVRLAGEAGVKMTGAGVTFPYSIDPRDRNIRIAPTLPPIEEIEHAMDVLSGCIELACVRKLTNDAS
jgi:aspartate/methionine/tyrosine aminotransferase